MNQILLLATLALGSFSLIDAKPTKAGSSQRPLVCQINSDIYTCPTGSSCSGDSVTLTYNGVDYDVTVCQKKGKGKGNDVSSSLLQKSCLITSSTGSSVKPETACDEEDETCSSSPITFVNGDDTYSATLCQGAEETIDLTEFLLSLGNKESSVESEEDGSGSFEGSGNL